MTMLAVPLFAGALMAIALSYAITAFLQRSAVQGYLIDVPNERSVHTTPMPRGGGIGIVCITLAGAAAAQLWLAVWPPLLFVAFIGNGALIAAIGLFDDARPLPPLVRLRMQLVAAVLMVAACWVVDSHDQYTKLIAGVLAVFWVVGLTNAYNFMDGIDGIAGLNGVVAGLAWAVLGWYEHMPMITFVGVFLAASSLGFLGHNWHPARIFMGDVGSTFLGFSFAALPLIAGVSKPSLAIAGPLLLLPFLFDTGFTLVGRAVSGENVFQAHRSHIFQKLVSAGLSHGEVSTFYGLLSAMGAVAAILYVRNGPAHDFAFLVAPAAGVCLLLTLAGATGSLNTLVAGISISRESLAHWLTRLEKIDHVNRVGVWLIQAVIFAFSGFLAFLLRFDLSIPALYHPQALMAIWVWVIAKLVVFRLHGLDRGWWRFVSIHDLLLIFAGNVAGSLCSTVFLAAMAPKPFPRSVYFIDFLISLLLTTGARLCVRISFDMVMAARPGQVKSVLIYGAGRVGWNLLSEIRSNPKLSFCVAGFVDDNRAKHGLAMHGARVLGGGADLPTLIRRHKVEEVLIALPYASGPEKSAVLTRCSDAGIRCRIVPAPEEAILGRPLTAQIRDIDVADLLNRSPIQLEENEIRSRLCGQVVMVTGAAGSIGSELCRMIARFQPSALVGFEIAESALFHLERDLRKQFPKLNFIPAVGSIQNPGRLNQVFREHRPKVVYHAAAYKHVPLMESHIIEAVENNVFGTYRVAQAAALHGASDFVLISSDKAVHPTNIMGATKRAAELVIGALQTNDTKFVSVRFGNVLGSNGSVVPLFQEQIAAGGPVTITDARMERYFMTIPEAAQLVLQASSMGKGGEVFVLDMGTRVKIADLARNMILLSGFQPGRDIKIEEIGARPGEKLYEELYLSEERATRTRHPKILVLGLQGVDPKAIMAQLNALDEACAARATERVLDRLKRIVPEYHATAQSEVPAESEPREYLWKAAAGAQDHTH